jgi:hypothetical protein
MLAGIALIFMALYIVLNSHTRNLIFIHKGSSGMLMFFGLAIIVSMYYQNFLGILVGLLLLLAMAMGLYFRSIMTSDLYEWILSLICILSLTGSSYAITEEILLSVANDQYSTQRISSVFFYPNYFGTITSTVILICAYKLITHQGQKLLYYFILFMNIISLYLCKSIFSFAEVFIGIAVLLFIFRKFKNLAFWICMAALPDLLSLCCMLISFRDWRMSMLLWDSG